MVEIAGKAGEVEEVTLRYVRLRDGDGYVHFIPNGEIKMVTNRTRGHAYATIDVGVPGGTRTSSRRAPRCATSAPTLRSRSDLRPEILGDVEILGVERWELWGMALRCRMQGAAARARQRAARIHPPADRASSRRAAR